MYKSKPVKIFCFFAVLILPVLLYSQSIDSLRVGLPNVKLKTLDNKTISLSELNNNGKSMILIFWKSCCSPNIKMLDEFNEVYSNWKEETGVKIYAISVDDARSSSRIAPLVNGKGWEYEVLLDLNSDCKRAMNVIATPHIFVLDGKKKLVWQKTTYNPGEEKEVYNILKNLPKE
jgi:cytochrome c biogenesis protein CcmG, thiol:disulfide interchange protein DsbE